jgi:hypothetical protein
MNSRMLAGVFDKSKMNESRLDEDLKALSKRSRPNLPTDFDATVWSKVRRREATSPGVAGATTLTFALRYWESCFLS